VPQFKTKHKSFLFWGLCLPIWEDAINFDLLDAILHFFTYSGWKIYQVDVVEEACILFLMKFHGGVDVQWFKPYICTFFKISRHFWSVFNDSKW